MLVFNFFLPLNASLKFCSVCLFFVLFFWLAEVILITCPKLSLLFVFPPPIWHTYVCLTNGNLPFLWYKPIFQTLTLPSMDCSDEAFMRHLDDGSLWQPSGRSHERWLKDLTLALIKSGGVRDEVLRLLEPVCLAKVRTFSLGLFKDEIHSRI